MSNLTPSSFVRASCLLLALMLCMATRVATANCPNCPPPQMNGLSSSTMDNIRAITHRRRRCPRPTSANLLLHGVFHHGVRVGR